MTPLYFGSMLLVFFLAIITPTKAMGLSGRTVEPFIFKLKPSIKNPDCIGAAGTRVSIKASPEDVLATEAGCRTIGDLTTNNNGGSPKIDVIFICGNGPGNTGTRDFKFALSYARGYQVTGYEQVLDMKVSGMQEIPAYLTITQGSQASPAVVHVEVLIGAKVDAKKGTAKYEYISCA